MCKNVEWMFCLLRGMDGVGNGQILFTLAPALLDMSGANWDNLYGFEENEIYPLEVCLLNEMCANGWEIFNRNVGEPFDCRLDGSRWRAAYEAILQLPELEGPPW